MNQIFNNDALRDQGDMVVVDQEHENVISSPKVGKTQMMISKKAVTSKHLVDRGSTKNSYTAAAS